MKEIIKQHNTLMKELQKIMEKELSFPLTIAVYQKNGKDIIYPIKFKNYIEKDIMRNALLKTLAEMEIKGYSMFSDVKITKKDLETGEMTPHDGMVATIFTAKKIITKFFIYEKGKVIDSNKTIDNRDGKNSQANEWDLWKTKEMDEKMIKEYIKFKEDNPEDYKDVK